MVAWFDLWSFVLGFILGVGVTAVGITIRVHVTASKSGDKTKVTQKNISAGGDVVGQDKTTTSQ